MEGQWFSRSPTLGTDLMALESVHLGQKQVIICTEIYNDNKRIKKKAQKKYFLKSGKIMESNI